MKAYYVTDLEEERAGVFFAETRGKAKARALYDGDYNFNDYMELVATRAPKFDKYADAGEVPKQALLDDGWHFWCENSNCYAEHITKKNGAQIVDGKVLCARCALKEVV